MANDILKKDVSAFTSEINGISQYYFEYQNTRRVKLSLNYSFGNKRNTSRRELDEEDFNRAD